MQIAAADVSQRMFEDVIDYLIENKKIRKRPEKVRETFTVIHSL
jgi:hypothetical protein